MTQLSLFYPNKVSVNRMYDPKLINAGTFIEYLGEAMYSHGDWIYRCLANVNGALCVVEAKITFR